MVSGHSASNFFHHYFRFFCLPAGREYDRGRCFRLRSQELGRRGSSLSKGDLGIERVEFKKEIDCLEVPLLEEVLDLGFPPALDDDMTV